MKQEIVKYYHRSLSCILTASYIHNLFTHIHTIAAYRMHHNHCGQTHIKELLHNDTSILCNFTVKVKLKYEYNSKYFYLLIDRSGGGWMLTLSVAFELAPLSTQERPNRLQVTPYSGEDGWGQWIDPIYERQARREGPCDETLLPQKTGIHTKITYISVRRIGRAAGGYLHCS